MYQCIFENQVSFNNRNAASSIIAKTPPKWTWISENITCLQSHLKRKSTWLVLSIDLFTALQRTSKRCHCTWYSIFSLFKKILRPFSCEVFNFKVKLSEINWNLNIKFARIGWNKRTNWHILSTEIYNYVSFLYFKKNILDFVSYDIIYSFK